MARKNRRRVPREVKRERRKHKLRHWLLDPLRILALAALGAALGFGAYQVAKFLKTSPALAVKTIEIKGLKRTSAKELLRAGRLSEGMNIFSVESGEIEKRVRDLPWVRRVTAHRMVPDRVVVEVLEHEPEAVINLGELYYVNGEGEVFKRALPFEKIDLPVLTGIDRRDFEKDRLRTRIHVAESLRLLKKLESLHCLGKREVAEVRFDELMGPSIVLDPGAQVIQFEAGTLSELGDLCRVFEEIDRHGIRAHTILMSRTGGSVRATVKAARKEVVASSRTTDSESK